jgi:hypothetical protein
MGDVFDVADQHAAECERERHDRKETERQASSDRQGVVWARVVAIEEMLKVTQVQWKNRWTFAVKLVGLAVGLSGAIMAGGLYFGHLAFVGAVTIQIEKQLDKRFPLGSVIKTELPAPKTHYAVRVP